MKLPEGFLVVAEGKPEAFDVEYLFDQNTVVQMVVDDDDDEPNLDN